MALEGLEFDMGVTLSKDRILHYCSWAVSIGASCNFHSIRGINQVSVFFCKLRYFSNSFDAVCSSFSTGASSSVSEGNGSTEAASASSQTDKKTGGEANTKEEEETEEAMEVSNGKEPSPSAKRDISEVASEDGDTATELPKQKNKKRCFVCNCKLELAIREIGRCRCDYVFCQLHRLPEQHDCIFDHKEKGRQDARDKMVSPKKHIGTSLKRIDSDSWLDSRHHLVLSLSFFGWLVSNAIPPVAH